MKEKDGVKTLRPAGNASLMTQHSELLTLKHILSNIRTANVSFLKIYTLYVCMYVCMNECMYV